MTRISILIPMRDAEAFVAATLRSILAQDGLDAGRDEIVIVDDGSADRSRAVAEEVFRGASAAGPCCRFRVIDGPRQGISAAMNAALAAAAGEWVCRCDADDLFPPGRLARQFRWLQGRPDFGAVCGSFSTLTARGRPLTDFDCGSVEEEITDELRRGVTRTHLGTFLARAESIRRAGGFRPWFVTAEDIDLQLRLGEVTRVGYEPVVSYQYRLHDASITHRQADVRRTFYESAARDFAAQRRATGADDLERGTPPAPPAAAGPAASAPLSSRHQVQQVLISASWRHHRDGRKGQALLAGWRACLARPGNPGAWRNLGTLAVKRSKATGATAPPIPDQQSKIQNPPDQSPSAGTR